jgi:signal transduction histidine kinase/ActR/RegA family two-component response regulator
VLTPVGDAYMPHGHCYLWQPALIDLHVISDGSIALAYAAISLTLVILVRRSGGALPFNWIFLAFGIFIVACGATHAMEIWTLWHPDYWLSGAVKAVTAIASVATALVLPPLVPRALELARADHLAKERNVLLAREASAREAEEQARRRVEAASRAKDEFLGNLSHELRTPLNAIVGWADLLSEQAVSGEQATEAIEVIRRSAHSQARLISDILDLSRMMEGRLTLELERCDPGAVARRALETIAHAVRAKGLHVRTTIESMEPILADPVRLQQVIWNLLSNAMKFTPRGGEVAVSVQDRGSHVVFRVTDTGKGIAPSFVPHLFDRFSQEDPTSTRQHGGLGLGLAIAKHLVELHGGTISAESAGEGRGATFTVQIPRSSERVQTQEETSRPARAGLADAELLLDGVRVLIVDDEEDARSLLRAVLELLGAAVVTVSSVKEALAAIDRWEPDAVVSDIAMPHEDGYALIREVRAREERGERPHLPVVALTAYAGAENQHRAALAGFDVHVAKPVEPAQLAALIARLVGRPGQQEALS